MKNVCIVVKKKISLENGGEIAVLNAFSLCGYAFDEVRILPQGDGAKLRVALTALKGEYENILLLCDRGALPVVRDVAVTVFPENTQISDFGNAGIFTDKSVSLFLLSADKSETGTGFAENACKPYLMKKYGLQFDSLVVRAVGASEARTQALVAQIRQECKDKLRVSYTRKYDEDRIELVYDSKTPKMTADAATRLLADGLGDTVYALSDISLEEQLVQLLKLRGKRLSVAESFTGGGVARRITAVSGASEVYFEGLNTYAEESKIKRLGVSEYGLRMAGAVSDQTAYEMALGLLNTGDCDISIATTGLAGPKSDRSMLPVGLCFIAVGTREKVFVYRYKFDGNREEITEKGINYALFHAYKQLKNM